MSSTASSTARLGSAANGAARRASVEQLVDGPSRPWRPWRRPAGRARRAGWRAPPAPRWRPVAHPLGDHGGLHQVAAVLGEHHPAETAPTWCPARPTRCRPLATLGRRLDLDHQVDRAHVDAQLQAGGGDDGGQPARLEVLLDQRPLLLGDRAVVRAGQDRRARPRPPRTAPSARAGRTWPCVGQRLAGRPARTRSRSAGCRQPLGQPAGVGEDEGGAVLCDQVGDRAPRRAAR